MATETKEDFDADDALSLCQHIIDHAGYARDAIERGDRKALAAQADEIEGWAQSLREVTRGEVPLVLSDLPEGLGGARRCP